MKQEIGRTPFRTREATGVVKRGEVWALARVVGQMCRWSVNAVAGVRGLAMGRLGRAGIFAVQLLASAVIWLSPGALLHAEPASNAVVVLIEGHSGEEIFRERFAAWSQVWQRAAGKAGVTLVVLRAEHEPRPASGAERAGTRSENPKPEREVESAREPAGERETNAPVAAVSQASSLKARLKDQLHALAATNSAHPSPVPTNSSPLVFDAQPLWLIFIGHGTFDGSVAKFNLPGDDLAAHELAEWLKAVRRPVAVINTAAASAPFLKALSAPGRVVITSTRSGHEQNFAYLGQYLAEAVADASADLDKDGETSLLEAWLLASRRTAEFYKTEGRLATEHSLLDDNGDGLGTPADWFRGVRAVKRARDGAPLDGPLAHQFQLGRRSSEQHLTPGQRARVAELELRLSRLREQKATLAEHQYYAQLETLLLELASLIAP